MNNYYVYRYIRLDNNTPFYVGASNKLNYARAYDIRARTKPFKDIYAITEIKVEIISEGLSKEEAEILETKFIALYGRLRDGGVLVNIIRKMPLITEETKRKLSQINKGLCSGEKHPQFGKTGKLAAFFGRKHTKESKNKMSEWQKGEKALFFGQKHKEETKEKIREKMKEYHRLRKLNKNKSPHLTI